LIPALIPAHVGCIERFGGSHNLAAFWTGHPFISGSMPHQHSNDDRLWFVFQFAFFISAFCRDVHICSKLCLPKSAVNLRHDLLATTLKLKAAPKSTRKNASCLVVNWAAD
jgi:hypothetical protein